MKTHELKCWPAFFLAVQHWEKMFEIRHNDRSFEVGDILWLREWDPTTTEYTGESVRRVVSYITDFPAGLRDGYVCMGLADLRTCKAERALIAKLERDFASLKSAVDTIPAALMLAGGPPYKLTFTEDCLREILESQK